MSVYAQDYGYFFNSNNSDRTYNADSFETWLKPFFLSGVFNGELQVLAQDAPDMTVQVTSGHANLDGKAAYWSGSNTLQLATASGVYNRIDTIVLRRDNTNRACSIEVVTGTAALNPTPKAPTRTADKYELVLAQIFVGVGVTEITQANITDTRMDSDICGYVAATVDQIDFDQIKAQYDAWAEETQEFFSDWFEAIRGQLDEDAAGHLQNEIDDINGDAVFKSTDLVNSFTETGTGKALDARAGKTLNDSLSATQEGIAIVATGDTHAAISSGQYVYVRGHGTLSEGLYKANAAIAEDATLTSSNVTAVSAGLGGELATLNSKITTKDVSGSITVSSTTGTISQKTAYRTGNIVSLAFILTLTTTVSSASLGCSATFTAGSGLKPINRQAGGSNDVNVLGINIDPSTDGANLNARTNTSKASGSSIWLTYTYICEG